VTRFNRGRLTAAIPCYLLIVPTYALLSLFTFLPFLWAFSTSLYDYEIGGTKQFAGLRNYTDFFSDPTFGLSMRNMLVLTLVAVIVNVTVPLAIAKLIFSLKSEHARYFYRALFLAPVVVPATAMQMIWGNLILSDHGLVNQCLQILGLGSLARGWLADPNTALAAVAFVGFPFASGINILIFYAGLSAIPETVHEAARLDGAWGLRKFLAIDVPLILSQVRLLVILILIAGIQSFEAVLILSRGGPGFETMVPGLWMYFNAFSFQKMGYACAIGVVLFALIVGLAFLNMRLVKSSEQLQDGR